MLSKCQNDVPIIPVDVVIVFHLIKENFDIVVGIEEKSADNQIN